MTAFTVFILLETIVVFGMFGYLAYRWKGISGLQDFGLGILITTMLFGVILSLHVIAYCAMETCQGSLVYQLLF